MQHGMPQSVRLFVVSNTQWCSGYKGCFAPRQAQVQIPVKLRLLI